MRYQMTFDRKFLRMRSDFSAGQLITHAQRSQKVEVIELPATRASLSAYSHLTVRERLGLMRFMIAGDEEHFNTAMQAWVEALTIANNLSEEQSARLFPRRFYSLRDLELEGLFLKAARAFRNAQWPDCVAFLQDWIQSNIDIRGGTRMLGLGYWELLLLPTSARAVASLIEPTCASRSETLMILHVLSR
jgi:hypothetical protein